MGAVASISILKASLALLSFPAKSIAFDVTEYVSDAKLFVTVSVIELPVAMLLGASVPIASTMESPELTPVIAKDGV